MSTKTLILIILGLVIITVISLVALSVVQLVNYGAVSSPAVEVQEVR